MLNRQIGSILRGKATRLQVLLATTLGGMLGFVPGFFLAEDVGGGFAQAPGLILVLICLALVANANLAIFGIATLVAKLLSMLLLPASFAVGTWLLDGPLQGLFAWLCNAQVTAWFGLEHYATTGGLVLGLLFGVGLGVLLNGMLQRIRLRMANVEENSEQYQKWSKKGWVRFCSWLFLGKSKGKKHTWRELAERNKLGLPIRISGVVVSTLLITGIVVFQEFFSTPLLTSNTKFALESTNGATVDLDEASLSLAAGTIRVSKFAMADKAELDKNLLEAEELVMTVDVAELLRRRLVIDEVKAVAAKAGTRRATPGVIIPPSEPQPEPEPAPEGVPTIEDYLEQYEVWKDRLEQAGEWFEDIFAGGEAPPAPSTPEEIEAEREQQIEEHGLAGVVATHLIQERPRVVIRRIDIEGITWTRDGVEDQLALRLRNLASNPWLLQEPATMSLATSSANFALDLNGPSGAGDGIGMRLQMQAVPVDTLFAGLSIDGKKPLQGGTVDIDVGGKLRAPLGAAMTMDLPLSVTLQNTTLALGSSQTPIESLVLPIGLKGALTRPSVYFENKAFARALLEAGKTELSNYVKDNAGKLLEGLPSDLGVIKDVLDPSKSPEQMAKDAQQKLEDAAKKKLEEEGSKLENKAKKELEKALPGLGGLLGGKKKSAKEKGGSGNGGNGGNDYLED